MQQLLKGNEAIAEAALRAGLNAYFGYPITPQTELLEYLACRMPERGLAFVQAESEVAAINMAYGAAAVGCRTMVSSSGPGISLMQEGLSYIAASELPLVLIDVMRGGPGLGNITASQSDYVQATHTGHGDFRPIVLAPATVQEAIDLTMHCFDLAWAYRTIATLLLDGNLSQMMEPAELPPAVERAPETPEWALSGAAGRSPRLVSSFRLHPPELEALNWRLQAKIAAIRAAEVRYTTEHLEDADLLVVGFGTAGRIAHNAVQLARAEGIAAGLFRPISLFPFPELALARLAERVRGILVIEMNAGQMLDDVRLAVAGRAPVEFYGRMGGVVPMPEEILEAIRTLVQATPARYAVHRVGDIR